MLMTLTLISLPVLAVIYLCLNKKHQEMVQNLFKKGLEWLALRFKKKTLKEGSAAQAAVEKKKADKEAEIKEDIKEGVREIQSEKNKG